MKHRSVSPHISNVDYESLLKKADLFRSQYKWKAACIHYERALDVFSSPEIRIQLAHCLKQDDLPYQALDQYFNAYKESNFHWSEPLLHASHLLKNLGFASYSYLCFKYLVQSDYKAEALNEIVFLENSYLKLHSKESKFVFWSSLPGILDLRKYKSVGISITNDSFTSTTNDAYFILDKHELPPYGFTIYTDLTDCTMQIFCDFGYGYEPIGHFRANKYNNQGLLFYPPDYEFIQSLKFVPTQKLQTYSLKIVRNRFGSLFNELLHNLRNKFCQDATKVSSINELSNIKFTKWDYMNAFCRHSLFREYNLLVEPINFEASHLGNSSNVFLTVIVRIRNSCPQNLIDFWNSLNAQDSFPFCVVFLIEDCHDESIIALVAQFCAEKVEFEASSVYIFDTLRDNANQSLLYNIKTEWFAIVDANDRLAHYAISALEKSFSQINSEAELIYTDEIIIDEYSMYVDTIFKPDFDHVMFSGMDYIKQLCLFRTNTALKLGIELPIIDTKRYYYLLNYLKFANTRNVYHIRYPLYQRRRMCATFVENLSDSHEDTVGKSLMSLYQADAFSFSSKYNYYKLKFLLDISTTVSIIIPSKDNYELVKRCIDGLISMKSIHILEIIIVDNGTTDANVIKYYNHIEGQFNVKVLYSVEEFNFSKMINKGVRASVGKYVLLLNNDIEIIDNNWLTEMLECFGYKNTAIVGAKLLYPNRCIQHTGVVVGLGNGAGHWFCNVHDDTPGPMGRLRVRHSYSAVTGACMLVDRYWFNKSRGFDEVKFPVAFNDVDFCLRVIELGGQVVLSPFAKLIHHESVSRGYDNDEKNFKRWRLEYQNFQNRWRSEKFDDPYFSPWLDDMDQQPNVQSWRRPRLIRNWSVSRLTG